MAKPFLAALSDKDLLENAQNSVFLKEQAIALTQRISAGNWTDHNTADPGITMLEILSFAISDLSYRLSFSVPDLLAVNTQAPRKAEPFFLPQAILPSNMVTHTDMKKAILDIDGIRNVAVLPATTQTAQQEQYSQPVYAIQSVQLMLQLESQWAQLPLPEQAPLMEKVRQTFLAGRNVNEDLAGIVVLQEKMVAIRMALAFENISDPVAKVAEVMLQCRSVIAPEIQKHAWQEMRKQYASGDDVYLGPVTHNGFIRPDELQELVIPEWIYTSDVLKKLKNIEGLSQVWGFHFLRAGDVNDLQHPDEKSYWRISVEPSVEVPDFALEQSLELLQVTIDGQAFVLDDEMRQQILTRVQQNKNAPASDILPTISDFIGNRYRNLNAWVSVQQDFPEIYELDERRMDSTTDPADYAHILQLKGFILLFEQILRDETAQLDNLRRLLGLPDSQDYQHIRRVLNAMLASEPLNKTMLADFWQGIRQLPRTRLSLPVSGVSGMGHLLQSYFETYLQTGFQQQAEAPFSQSQLHRLNAASKHLLARFAETPVDPSLLKYRAVFSHYLPFFQNIPDDISTDAPMLDKLVSLKALLDQVDTLAKFDSLSRDRAGGMNYLTLTQQGDAHIGLTNRIASKLGLSHPGQLPLAVTNRENFYLLESELIRHGASQQDYKPNQLYFVVPDWPARFANGDFLNVMKEQIRAHSPVHQQVVFIAVSRAAMSLFERLYFCWLNAMSQKCLKVENLATKATISLPYSVVQSGLNKSSSDNSSSDNSSSDNSSSDKSPSDRASSVQDSHIASLSGYLRDFVEAPADLLVQILSTMVQDDLANPWQPLLDALHTWLGLGQNTFVGDSFAAIEQELSDWLSSEHSSQVADANLSQSNLANANQPTKHKDHFENSDNILFAIAHNHLTEMFNPNPVGQANIGDDFRIGYQPLAFLQPSYPVASAFISPGSQNKPNFTVQIQTPLSI